MHPHLTCKRNQARFIGFVFRALLTVKVSLSSLGDNGMTAPCNVNCSCSLATINPVCGEDNLAYFSPCHAGCKVSQDEKVIEKKIPPLFSKTRLQKTSDHFRCLVRVLCECPPYASYRSKRRMAWKT